MAIIAYGGIRPDGTPLHGLFDTEKAKLFPGNFRPLDDGSAGTAKEDLYLTDQGDWIKNHITLNSRNAAGGDTSVYVLIDETEARTWLKAKGYEEAATRYFERPKGGRPPAGERLPVRVPALMREQISEIAERYGESVPDAARRLLGEALDHRRIVSAL